MRIKIHKDNYSFSVYGETQEIGKLFSKEVSIYNKRSLNDSRQPRYINEEISLYDRIRNITNEVIFKYGTIYTVYKTLRNNSIDYKFEDVNDLKTDFVYSSDSLGAEKTEDLNKLIKYRCGMFQAYTGYGKSKVICRSSEYFIKEQGLNVLVVVPNSRVKIELESKFEKFEIDIDKLGDKLKIMNALGFSRRKEYKEGIYDEYYSKVDVIICDEVEYCMNESFVKFCDEKLTNAKYYYGFSATAEKQHGNKLSGEMGQVNADNLNLIKYFGGSLVYKRPEEKKNITLHLVRKDFGIKNPWTKPNDTILDLGRKMYPTVQFMNAIIYCIRKSKGIIFAPLNALQIIDKWTDYFNKFGVRFLVLSSRGNYYQNEYVSQDRVKYLTDNNLIDVIFTTASGYRGINIKNIKNILMIVQSTKAGIVLQCIGRSRSKNTNIYFIDPTEKIDIYSGKVVSAVKLIQNYYSNIKYKIHA